jgi:tetratricopeptide (TPR) repeat protein
MKYIFLFTLFSISCYSQGLEELFQKSKTAYKAKDYAQFLSITERLDSIRPSHPVITYNLAAGYALNNKPEPAIKVLQRLILMNNNTNFEADADFISIKEQPGYSDLLQLKSDLEKTVSHSEKVTTLTEQDLHPEGLLYLNKSKTWLATSIHKGKIVSFDIGTGTCSDWLNTGDMLSVFSVRADKAEKYLWAATAAMPEMENYNKGTQGRGEILKIDIASKKIVKRFPLEGNHVFGDLAVADNGTVYISDSGDADIYQIQEDVLSKWLSLEKAAFNLQGVAFNDTQDVIYIADYFKGILMIPVAKPQDRKWLIFPGNTSFKGIDGLTFYENSLIAIQNGVKPIRVMQFEINQKNNIIGYKVIDHNRAEFNEPPLGIIKDGSLYFFGNAPWAAYGKDSKLDLAKVSNPELYRFKL